MQRWARAIPFLFLASAALDAASTPVPVGPQFQVNSTTTGVQARPSIDSATSGFFVVVWQDFFELVTPHVSVSAIRGQRIDPQGLPHGLEIEIEPLESSLFGKSGKVSSGASGEFVVAWDDESLGGSYWDQPARVHASRLAEDGSPLGATAVTLPAVFDQFDSAIDADSSGNFIVVWTSGDAALPTVPDLNVFGRSFSANGAPDSAPFPINSYTSADQESPDLAVLADGRFLVVWSNAGAPPGGDTSSGGITGRLYDASAEPSGAEFPVNSFTTGLQDQPAIAAIGDDGFVVVWESSAFPVGGDDSSQGIAGRIFSGDLPQSDDFQVNSFTSGAQLQPAVATDSDGDFVVVWQSELSAGNDSSGSSIQGQRFSRTGVPKGGGFQINDHTTGDQLTPDVATDASGDFFVVWTSGSSPGNDSDSWSIQGRRFRVTGDLQGSVFLDRNGDGVRGPAEPGVGGVAVELSDDTATLRRTTVTDAAGNYSFKPKEGDWTVKFVPPSSSWQFTSQDTGADDAVDSDADPTTGETDPFPIAIDVLDSTVDAGFLPDLFADGFESGDTLLWSSTSP